MADMMKEDEARTLAEVRRVLKGRGQPSTVEDALKMVAAIDMNLLGEPKNEEELVARALSMTMGFYDSEWKELSLPDRIWYIQTGIHAYQQELIY